MQCYFANRNIGIMVQSMFFGGQTLSMNGVLISTALARSTSRGRLEDVSARDCMSGETLNAYPQAIPRLSAQRLEIFSAFADVATRKTCGSRRVCDRAVLELLHKGPGYETRYRVSSMSFGGYLSVVRTASMLDADLYCLSSSANFGGQPIASGGLERSRNNFPCAHMAVQRVTRRLGDSRITQSSLPSCIKITLTYACYVSTIY